jgi:hypothetical protein
MPWFFKANQVRYVFLKNGAKAIDLAKDKPSREMVKIVD